MQRPTARSTPPPMVWLSNSMLAPLFLGPVLLSAGAASAGGTACAPCSPPPPPPPCNCAPTTHQVKTPGVSVSSPSINIGVATIGFGAGGASFSGVADASASALGSVSVNVSTNAGAANQNTAGLLGSFGGAGSGFWTGEGGVTTEITEVTVQPLQPAPPPAPICLAWKTAARPLAVQAVCIDDKATPHPASQVSPDRTVADAYQGEVFRCIAGTRLQYTVADFGGQPDFSHGQTITCQKGEALFHSPQGGLQCRPQIPARDCNERSLLRRFGAGIKVMTGSGQRVCTAWGPAPVASAIPPGPRVLN